MKEEENLNPWARYQKYTAARIGLPLSGGSIGTKEMLNFKYDHAMARDAVWAECDFEQIKDQIKDWMPSLILKSKAISRQEYLMRPDLGRLLDGSDYQTLEKIQSDNISYDLVFCIVDGLSPLGISKNLVNFLSKFKENDFLKKKKMAPLVCVKNGRVAIGDQVAVALKSKVVVVLIGERPGLSSADSIGAYLTYDPVIGTTDERRNCISNIRPEGLNFDKAKDKLMYLLETAFSRKITGVNLKDRMNDRIEGQIINEIAESQ